MSARHGLHHDAQKSSNTTRPRNSEKRRDLPANLIEPFFTDAQSLARAVEKGMGAHGTFVAMNNRVSQSVPHLHVHVVPRRRKDGLRGFFWPRYPYQSDEEADSAQTAIRAALDVGDGKGSHMLD